MIATPEVSERIEQAKTHMILSEPWWASMLLRLKCIESESYPTMATNGSILYYNPGFVMRISTHEMNFVLMHEVAHCVLLHPWRCMGRNRKLWNLACDAVVNAMLVASGLYLPQGAVPPAAANLTAEDVYQQLRDNKDLYKEFREDPYDCDVLEAGECQEEAEGTKANDWRIAIEACRGTQPGGLNRIIEQSVAPVRDWISDIAAFVSARAATKMVTWLRRSRRYPVGPGRKPGEEFSIGICVDNSGSVVTEKFSAFARECKAILSLEGVTAHVMFADAAVQFEMNPGDPFPESTLGGGGTSFIPALTRCQELGVDGVIYFTDGQGEYPEKRPDLDVLWVLTSPVEVPFGRSVRFYGS